ncbi:AmmeMemoRadiSam system protein A [Thermodesulfobacteriota bacterium]
MSTLTDAERIVLLKLARSVIESEIIKNKSIIRPREISPALNEKRGCFVTLHQNEALRGCIGTIEPAKPLISCVEENAVNAAFRDPRFSPLDKDELTTVDIEISVLTVPRQLEFKDGEDLKEKLKPGIHGVILSQGYRRATFLPQVWEQLPEKEAFLGHLCQKGSMAKKAWLDRETKVEVYEAEYFSEKQLIP